MNSSKALGSVNESDEGMWLCEIAVHCAKNGSFAEVYNSAIDFAEELLPPAIYNAFLFSLSLHIYSPTVQLFQQVIISPCYLLYVVMESCILIALNGGTRQIGNLWCR